MITDLTFYLEEVFNRGLSFCHCSHPTVGILPSGQQKLTMFWREILPKKLLLNTFIEQFNLSQSNQALIVQIQVVFTGRSLVFLFA